jgi:hypothetical protein
MKDIAEVMRQKQCDLARLREEVNALRNRNPFNHEDDDGRSVEKQEDARGLA